MNQTKINQTNRKKAEILAYLAEDGHRYAHTVYAISVDLGYSQSSVRYHLKKLTEEKKVVRWNTGLANNGPYVWELRNGDSRPSGSPYFQHDCEQCDQAFQSAEEHDPLCETCEINATLEDD